MLSRLAVFLVGVHDGGDDGVEQHGGHPPNNRLIETCSLGLRYIYDIWHHFSIYDIMLWSIDTCQIKLFADKYHAIISQAQVYISSRPRVLLKLTADQVLVSIGSLAQVKLICWKQNRVAWKPVNPKPGLKVNRIVTVSSLQMLCFTAFVSWLLNSKLKAKQPAENASEKLQTSKIKIQPYPGLNIGEFMILL